MCRPTSKRGIVKEEKMKNWERARAEEEDISERRQQRERKTVVHIWSLLLNEKCDVSFSISFAVPIYFQKMTKQRAKRARIL